jgi:hypothetical protein
MAAKRIEFDDDYRLRKVIEPGWDETLSFMIILSFTQSVGEIERSVIQKVVRAWFTIGNFGGFGGFLEGGPDIDFRDEKTCGIWVMRKRMPQTELDTAIEVLHRCLERYFSWQDTRATVFRVINVDNPDDSRF